MTFVPLGIAEQKTEGFGMNSTRFCRQSSPAVFWFRAVAFFVTLSLVFLSFLTKHCWSVLER